MYPVTIMSTRYGGTYEGGPWAAFNLDPEDIPSDATADDVSCCAWWVEYGAGVGTGETPQEALDNLLSKDKVLNRNYRENKLEIQEPWG